MTTAGVCSRNFQNDATVDLAGAHFIKDVIDIFHPRIGVMHLTSPRAANANVSCKSLRVPTIEPVTLMPLSTSSKIGTGSASCGRTNERHFASASQRAERAREGPCRNSGKGRALRQVARSANVNSTKNLQLG